MRKLKRKVAKVVYEQKQCAFVYPSGNRCKNYAAGKSTLCKRHGGDARDRKVLNEITHDSFLTHQNSKYNPSLHPVMFMQLAREGLSLVEIAAEMEVSERTLSRWSEKYPLFAEVFEIGKALHEAWYLAKAKNNLTNTRFQTGLFKFIAANKLGYADRVENKNINENRNVGVLLVPNKMSIEEWEKSNEDEDTIDAEFTEETAGNRDKTAKNQQKISTNEAEMEQSRIPRKDESSINKSSKTKQKVVRKKKKNDSQNAPIRRIQKS